MQKKSILLILLLYIVCMTAKSQNIQNVGREKTSETGNYLDYSSEKYDSYHRESIYIPMSDGTRIALDIYHPSRNGIVEQNPLPLIWMHTRYTRALKGPNGKVISLINSPIGMTFIKQGYILAIADARGTGASFGVRHGIFTKEDARDAYEIMEWFASQEWCNNNIGMMGGSYEGVSQLMAASSNSPHLKAIFPAMFLFDLYDFPYHNGIYYDDCIVSDKEKLSSSLGSKFKFIAPIDSDSSKTLLKEAYIQRSGNRSLHDFFSAAPFRDSYDSITQSKLYLDWGPSNYIQEINESGVAVYLYGGWFDLFSKDAFLLYKNLTVPKKLLMIDSPHSSGKDPDLLKLFISEQLRWFDYWLKGIQNDIMDEPPVALQEMRRRGNHSITYSNTWPLSEQLLVKAYFHQGTTGSIHSTNDGLLDMIKPHEKTGADLYKADFSTSSGNKTRWDDAAIKKFHYPDMSSNDEKGVTYTTLTALQDDLTVCGHPVIHCWISSSTSDHDLYAYLEDVDSTGVSNYITEGCIRASFSKLDKAPYDNLGLPYHRCFQEDMNKIEPGEIRKLSFDLLPIYYRFKKGHRIRVTLTCADRDNTHSHRVFSEPEISLHRNSQYPSHIELPLLQDN
jgi:putative CocE/NonD family hydrolase